ncbi:MAG: Bug family tripartite tricarboxylate transporter substrate binding protein, partial [Candidatus Binatia bacterium]
MNTSRRLLLVAALMAGFAGPAAADTFPSRPIKLIVPFGAGGPADVFARFLAEHMSDSLKQSVVVENRP